MRNFFDKSFTWIKEKFLKLLIGGAFWLVVYLLSHYNFIAALFVVIVGNVLIEYFWNFNIVAKKITLMSNFDQAGKIFNSDYYDLYWDFNKSRIQLLLIIITTCLPLSQEIIFFGWNWEIILFVIGFAFWVFICCIGHNNKVFYKLINFKMENYEEYSSQELAILKELK